MSNPAGRRNTKILIEQRTEGSVNTVGDPVYTWATFATEWAFILTQSGKEFMDARQQFAELSHLITIRYTAGITTDMRINVDGVYYKIIAAFDPMKRGIELKLYCNEQL